MLNHLPQIELLMHRKQALDQWQYPELAAPYWRLYWNEKPGWSITCNQQNIRLLPTHMYLIPPETHFSAHSERSGVQHYCHFTVSHPYTNCAPHVYQSHIKPENITYFKQINEELTGPQFMRLNALLYELLSEVPIEHLHNARIPEDIQLIQKHMLQNLQLPSNNDTLAEELGMNTNAFIRRFKQHTGLSPKAWLIDQRIAESCRLLHHSDLSIEQIAMQTGFYDRYHFSRVFKQRRNVSPARFRLIYG